MIRTLTMKCCCILLSLISAFNSNAQAAVKTAPVASDFEIKECPVDKSASAYYLFDIGKVTFDFNQGPVQQTFRRSLRIHILNSSALDYGNFVLPLYGNDSRREVLFSIRASVYNLESGRVKETIWNKEDIIYDNVNDSYQLVKIALPQVSVGSIIEIEYAITREGQYYVRDWEFQNELPTMLSTYHVEVPEFFEFKTIIKGYYDISEKSSARVAYMTTGLSDSHPYQIFDLDYSADSIPAFKEHTWLFCKDDYIAQIEFQLNVVRMPFQQPFVVSKTWEDVAELFQSHDQFGRRMSRTNHLDNLSKSLKSTGFSGEMLFFQALAEFPLKMKWNEVSRSLTSDQLKVTYEKGIGNSADLNLNLVGLLQSLGFKAYPVLVSTQQNGCVYEQYATPDIFNYVVVEVVIGEKTYLVDATQSVIEPNQLPERCLNGRGLVLDEKSFHWANLLCDQRFMISSKHEVNLTSVNNITGKSKYEYAQFAKNRIRNQYNNDKSKYIEYIEKRNAGMKLTACDFDSIHVHCNKIVETRTFNLSDKVNEFDGKIIFPITLFWGTEENPIGSETRDYPVEMSYPFKTYDLIEIQIPEGYELESLPKSSVLQTSDKGCKYALTIVEENHVIKVVSALTITKIFHEPQEYPVLHDFFDKMVEKDQEKVILKKI